MQPTVLHTECKQNTGGSTGDQDNGNPRNSSWLNKKCSDLCGCSKLHPSASDRHDTVLHVGLPDLPERHSGAASEIDFRSHLRARDAGAVGVLFRLLLVLVAMVEIRKPHWISKNHGRWTADHVNRSVPFSTCGIHSFVSSFLDGASDPGGWYYRPSGIRESLRGFVGQA